MSDSQQAQYEKNKPVSVEIDDGKVYVTLADGRVIGNPLDWHPWLLKAAPEQRSNVRLYHLSVFWPDLDEGLDIEGMMRGVKPRTIQAV